jgi:hypothetical protein
MDKAFSQFGRAPDRSAVLLGCFLKVKILSNFAKSCNIHHFAQRSCMEAQLRRLDDDRRFERQYTFEAKPENSRGF